MADDIGTDAAMLAEALCKEAVIDLEVEREKVDSIDEAAAKLLAEEIAKLAISDMEVEGIRYGAIEYSLQASLEPGKAGTDDRFQYQQLVDTQRRVALQQMLAEDKATLTQIRSTGVNPVTGDRLFTPGPKNGEPNLASLIEATFADYEQQHTVDCVAEVEKILREYKQNAEGEKENMIYAKLAGVEAKTRAEAKAATRATKAASKAKAKADAEAANTKAANALTEEAQTAAEAEAAAAAKVGALKAEVEEKARKDAAEKARKQTEEKAEIERWNKVFEDKAEIEEQAADGDSDIGVSDEQT
jgi:hypothetical protein